MRKSHCQACQNIETGVKTRISVEHTCGLSSEEILKKMKEAQGKQPFQDRIAPNKKSR